jgi:hypothetical protein
VVEQCHSSLTTHHSCHDLALFIDRPIFAAVLSIFITITGGVAALSLPIAQRRPR